MNGTTGTYFRAVLLFILASLVFPINVLAEKLYKPFILANQQQGSMQEVTKNIIDKLGNGGFSLVGRYSPYPETTILIVTNDALLSQATKSDFGAFGVAQRVTLTQINDSIQVSYTNPSYMAHAYRMQGDLDNVTQQLILTLGKQTEYGPDEGLSKDDLRDYQYKWMMPYFSDWLALAKYKDQTTALDKINAIFSNENTGVKKVYQIDLPNKQETVIGVQMTGENGNDCSADQYIMSRIDYKKLKSAGHLPYEIVVSKGQVLALMAEFRIAINFPDLSMMGSNSFASIMCAPNSIESALTMAAGGEIED